MKRQYSDGSPPARNARAPLIVNQVGPLVRAAIEGHWSRPTIMDHPPDRPPWDIPADADILLTRPFAGWEKASVEKPANWPSRLSWIQTASTGVDFFPPWFLEGTIVTTGRGIPAIPIAEYVMAAIFAFEKRFKDVQARRSTDWGKESGQSSFRPLFGKVLGIAGFGSIGRAVADRALPFGMSIKVLRRSSHEPEPGIETVASIKELIATVDHLVLALPVTAKTVRMINADVLARSKKSLHLINVARGKIVNQVALLQALDDGKLAGATLDVTDPEPPEDGDPIYWHPKLVLTPHISWTSEENTRRLAEKTLINLESYVRGIPLADIFDKNLEY